VSRQFDFLIDPLSSTALIACRYPFPVPTPPPYQIYPMAILDGIEVSIISDDRALVEYSDPDREDQNDVLATEKYIEASTGSKFAVRYTIKPTFRLYHAQGVHVSIHADGQYATGRNVSEHWLGRQKWEETVTTMTYFCHDRGIWMDAKMAFGGIQIGRPASSPP
jgi:hypothetical protein